MPPIHPCMEEATMTRHLIGPLVTLALAILVAPLTAEAQQPKHVPRIGLLITNSRATESRLSWCGSMSQ